MTHSDGGDVKNGTHTHDLCRVCRETAKVIKEVEEWRDQEPGKRLFGELNYILRRDG